MKMFMNDERIASFYDDVFPQVVKGEDDCQKIFRDPKSLMQPTKESRNINDLIKNNQIVARALPTLASFDDPTGEIRKQIVPKMLVAHSSYQPLMPLHRPT